MKHLICALFICTTYSNLWTMKMAVQLPSQEVLKQRLIDNNYRFIEDDTSLSLRLANKKEKPLEIVKKIDEELYELAELYEHLDIITTHIKKHRSTVIRIILSDHPQALKDLTEIGCLTENK